VAHTDLKPTVDERQLGLSCGEMETTFAIDDSSQPRYVNFSYHPSRFINPIFTRSLRREAALVNVVSIDVVRSLKLWLVAQREGEVELGRDLLVQKPPIGAVEVEPAPHRHDHVGLI